MKLSFQMRVRHAQRQNHGPRHQPRGQTSHSTRSSARQLTQPGTA